MRGFSWARAAGRLAGAAAPARAIESAKAARCLSAGTQAPAAPATATGRRSGMQAARLEALLPRMAKAFESPPGEPADQTLLHLGKHQPSHQFAALSVWLKAREAALQLSLADDSECGVVKCAAARSARAARKSPRESLLHAVSNQAKTRVDTLCPNRLDPSVWNAPLRADVVHGVVKWQLANRRQGNAMVRLAPDVAQRLRSQLTIVLLPQVRSVSQIRGTGKKLYNQKGLGKARHGR